MANERSSQHAIMINYHLLAATRLLSRSRHASQYPLSRRSHNAAFQTTCMRLPRDIHSKPQYRAPIIKSSSPGRGRTVRDRAGQSGAGPDSPGRAGQSGPGRGGRAVERCCRVNRDRGHFSADPPPLCSLSSEQRHGSEAGRIYVHTGERL